MAHQNKMRAKASILYLKCFCTIGDSNVIAKKMSFLWVFFQTLDIREQILPHKM